MADSPEQYLEQLPEDRKQAVQQLRETILENLPEGFTETMSYGMIGYVVPYTVYPAGYHCNPTLPLPFVSIASQKNFVALYHMGLYANKALLEWFTNEYPKYSKTKLDMGKSCIQFKKPAQNPFQLIGALAGKMRVAEWIELYESQIRK